MNYELEYLSTKNSNDLSFQMDCVHESKQNSKHIVGMAAQFIELLFLLPNAVDMHVNGKHMRARAAGGGLASWTYTSRAGTPSNCAQCYSSSLAFQPERRVRRALRTLQISGCRWCGHQPGCVVGTEPWMIIWSKHTHTRTHIRRFFSPHCFPAPISHMWIAKHPQLKMNTFNLIIHECWMRRRVPPSAANAAVVECCRNAQMWCSVLCIKVYGAHSVRYAATVAPTHQPQRVRDDAHGCMPSRVCLWVLACWWVRTSVKRVRPRWRNCVKSGLNLDGLL